MHVVRNDQEAGKVEAACVPSTVLGYFDILDAVRSVPIITKGMAWASSWRLGELSLGAWLRVQP